MTRFILMYLAVVTALVVLDNLGVLRTIVGWFA